MKLKLILLFSALFLIFSQLNFVNASISQTTKDSKTDGPLLVIVLMVKNEEPVMAETLKPFVEAGMQDFFIFDTGSEDKTIEVTEEFFKKHNVKNYIIKQEPFIDFASSRNRALDLTEEHFPNAKFMLMLDAEWYMHGVKELIEYCKIHENDTTPSHFVRIIMNETLDFQTSRLLRCFTNTRFKGVVHETIFNTSLAKVPGNIFFEVKTSHFGLEKSKKRWVRDVNLLLKENAQNPDNPRTIFYLAQTYHCLGDLENARIWFEKRINTPGWYEENFVALYRLAQVYEALSQWDKALNYYMKAYSFRPCRVEPLVKVAQHYLDAGERELCYLFAKRATEVPYPSSDILFVEKDLYDLTRYDLLGISAWYLGEYEIGKQAVLQALATHPNMPHLQKNLECYNASIAANMTAKK